MKALVLKELRSLFCSSAGAFFVFAFLLTMGAMLWVFSGSYNIIDREYADMRSFFHLAPVLLAILIPALTMRLFSEEKKNKTLDVLMTRPVTILKIYLSKFLSSFIFIFLTLISTVVYIYSLYQLANPVGNIDIEAIVVSYISLLLLAAVFISIGLLGSVITKNQIVALIFSVFICLFVFYGFDLLTGFFFSGKMQTIISSTGLSYHYDLMQRGVIEIENLIFIANYLVIFSVVALLCLGRYNRRIMALVVLMVLVSDVVLCFIPNIRFDFTADKRYTLSDYSKKILQQVKEDENLEINIYLNGDLNYGFQHLQNATDDLLKDFNRYANNNIDIKYSNPYQLKGDGVDVYEFLSELGMPGIMLHEGDREGKISKKIIYPYAQLTNGKDTLVVSLLKNVAGNTANENLNASIESLEFEFIDAISLLNRDKAKTVAFIDGHEELSRAYVYDAEELLSKYYFVNRGQITNDIGVLDDFDAIIIAGPLLKYTQSEKYIIDQYIMAGGKVLWLVDGVYYSHQELSRVGYSASMKNDTNLDDVLFNYGVRINSDLIQDRQCISTYAITDGNTQSAILIPDFYRPLLIPSPNHPVTKNMRDVKAGFASSIDVVNNSPDIKKEILLTSSANAHLIQVPDPIDFDVERIQNQPDYFNQPYIPVAVSLEGNFISSFSNRMIPDSVNAANHKTIVRSESTKMIVVSSSDIISNEIRGQGNDSEVLPMGYDRVSQQQYGNRDFIINALNWLTGDDELMALRTKQQKMYILNKKTAFENRNKYMALNLGIPLLFMVLVMSTTYLYRKKKYEGDADY